MAGHMRIELIKMSRVLVVGLMGLCGDKTYTLHNYSRYIERSFFSPFFYQGCMQLTPDI